jgi:hypothetical protein
MIRATVNAICKSMPSAELTDPWGGGHDTWKIGGKMFASIGSMGGGVAVKCATVQDALHLEDMFGWPRHRIFTARWCLCPWIRARQSCAIALKSRTLSSAPR